MRGQLLVGVARDQRRTRPRPSRPAGRVGRPARGTLRGDPLGVRSASSTSSPPPASTTGWALSACSPLPIGSGTKTAGQPDGGGLGDGVRARPADHQVGGGVREVHPVDVRHDDVRRGTPGLRASTSLFGPDDVQHLDARAARAPRAAPDDRLVEPARALRPAGDQQRRPVGVEPEERARLGAQRAAVEGARSSARIGRPTYCALRQRRVREAHRDRRGEPGAEPLARPGTAFGSWTTIGTLRRRAAR